MHFVGDVHQPLHTVLEDRGGNDIAVVVDMNGLTCKRNCQPAPIATNLHAAWDTHLIAKTVWDWGAYVDRLEAGWLRNKEAASPGIDADFASRAFSATHTARRNARCHSRAPDLQTQDGRGSKHWGAARFALLPTLMLRMLYGLTPAIRALSSHSRRAAASSCASGEGVFGAHWS